METPRLAHAPSGRLRARAGTRRAHQSMPFAVYPFLFGSFYVHSIRPARGLVRAPNSFRETGRTSLRSPDGSGHDHNRAMGCECYNRCWRAHTRQPRPSGRSSRSSTAGVRSSTSRTQSRYGPMGRDDVFVHDAEGICCPGNFSARSPSLTSRASSRSGSRGATGNASVRRLAQAKRRSAA
jgi:hypothetical protein